MIPPYLYFIYNWLEDFGWSIEQVEEHMKRLNVPPATYCFDEDRLQALELLRKYRNVQ